MMSPGTSSSDGTSMVLPPRMILAVGAAISRSAESAFSARAACNRPKMALMITIARIAIESPNRSRNPEPGSGANSPSPAAMAAAPSSASTVKSETWP